MPNRQFSRRKQEHGEKRDWKKEWSIRKESDQEAQFKRILFVMSVNKKVTLAHTAQAEEKKEDCDEVQGLERRRKRR